MSFWKFAKRVWQEQHKLGGLVFLEQPWQSEALKLPEMESREPLFRAKTAQCMVGLRDPISAKPMRKDTALDTNRQVSSRLLETKCSHAPEEHQVIEGSVFFEGRSQKRSVLAGRWPKELCVRILKAAETVWHKPETNSRWTLHGESGPNYVAALEEPAEDDEGPEAPAPGEDVEVRRQLEMAQASKEGNYGYIHFQSHTPRQSRELWESSTQI